MRRDDARGKRHVYARASGQPALAFYHWDEEEGAYIPFALNVLTIQGDRISDVTAFICRSIESPNRSAYERFPEEPVDPVLLEAYFGRFGLPARLD